MSHNPGDVPPSSPQTERFPPSNGVVSGYIGLAITVGILVLAVLPWDAGRPLGVAMLAVLGILLVWVTMLRPALWVSDRTLVLRGIYHTDHVPLGSIDKVAVSQVTAISVRGKRYVSPVVGFTARQKVRNRHRDVRAATSDAPLPERNATNTYQLYVEDRLTQLAKEDRERFGPTDAPVRRTWAWPEIAGTAVLIGAFLVWLLAF